jgi:catechol 2,3-dioxygenase-like lactoylglutathione lyase family enzyme
MSSQSSTPIRREPAARTPSVETADLKLEVVVIPVSDVDRAKRFYVGLGWRLDADHAFGADRRLVQLTPPGSTCSIQFGAGVTAAAPGSAQGQILVVDDMGAARAKLIGLGVEVSEPFHFDLSGNKGRVQGPDPERRSYNTRAQFRDPDGNAWVLQEVTARLPGRVTSYQGLLLDAATLRELLQETEKHHGEYEPTAPKHDWSIWYSSYMVARERGRASDEAARDAALHVERSR